MSETEFVHRRAVQPSVPGPTAVARLPLPGRHGPGRRRASSSGACRTRAPPRGAAAQRSRALHIELRSALATLRLPGPLREPPSTSSTPRRCPKPSGACSPPRRRRPPRRTSFPAPSAAAGASSRRARSRGAVDRPAARVSSRPPRRLERDRRRKRHGAGRVTQPPPFDLPPAGPRERPPDEMVGACGRTTEQGANDGRVRRAVFDMMVEGPERAPARPAHAPGP